MLILTMELFVQNRLWEEYWLYTGNMTNYEYFRNCRWLRRDAPSIWWGYNWEPDDGALLLKALLSDWLGLNQYRIKF
jgi:hypothetical protein